MINLLNLDSYIGDMYSLTVADTVVYTGTYKAMNAVNNTRFDGKGLVQRV